MKRPRPNLQSWQTAMDCKIEFPAEKAFGTRQTCKQSWVDALTDTADCCR